MATPAFEPGKIAGGIEGRGPVPMSFGQCRAHRGEVCCGDQPVASPADGEGPDGTGELTVDRLHQAAQLLVGRATLDGGTGVDHDQVCIRCNGVDHLQIHGRFAVALARHATDHLRGEWRQVEPVGEIVHILLVETVETEDHDRGPFTGVSLVGEGLDVVGAQQLGGHQPAIGNVAGWRGR